jgi:type III secretion protein W
MNPIDSGAISRNMIPSSLGLGAGGAADMQSHTQTGSFRGETVVPKDIASILKDAAEEITMGNSEKAEEKMFTDLKIGAEAPIQVQKIQEINEYLDAAKVFDDPKKLADLAKRMQSGGENPRELARQQTGDPTQQFMLLQYALVDGEAKGVSAAVLDDLRDALADLEMDAGPQIRAGLNTIGVAAQEADTAQGIASFQGTYRDVVLGDNSLAQTLKLVLERLGGPQGEDMAKGMQGLIKALGADLSAARPSTDSNRLHALVQDLYQLEVAATVLDNCRDLATRLDNKHGTSGVQPAVLMSDMISLTGEKWVGAPRFTALADKHGVREVDAQIAFHTGTKAMLRDLPPKVFPDADTRQSILGAVQNALDEAIDKEEG